MLTVLMDYSLPPPTPGACGSRSTEAARELPAENKDFSPPFQKEHKQSPRMNESRVSINKRKQLPDTSRALASHCCVELPIYHQIKSKSPCLLLSVGHSDKLLDSRTKKGPLPRTHYLIESTPIECI